MEAASYSPRTGVDARPAGSLVELALRLQWIEPGQLQLADRLAGRQGLSRHEALYRCGFLSLSQICSLQQRISGTAQIDLGNTVPEAAALALLPVVEAWRLQALPIQVRCRDAHRRVVIAVADATDMVRLDRLRDVLPDDIRLEVQQANPVQLRQALIRCYRVEHTFDSLLQTYLHEDWQIDQAGDSETRSITALLNALFTEAVRRSASDIHLEPLAHGIRIGLRIFGELDYPYYATPAIAEALVQRVKLTGGMDIAEQRRAQDGMASVSVDGRQIDLRMSCLPGLYGESVVIRVLDQGQQELDIGRLSDNSVMPDQHGRDRLRQLLVRRQGMVLVCGPTGSGKSTTLYSMLSGFRDSGLNIISLEDPVELRVPGIRQCSLPSTRQMSFAEGLRAILRQDPDIILVGEIRDAETALLAFRAATTGHLVLSTVHAASFAGVVDRLFDLGISKSMLLSQLQGIVVQQLVRKLCPFCRDDSGEHGMPESTGGSSQCVAEPGAPANTGPGVEACPPTGCEFCDQTGYHGRFALQGLWVAGDTDLPVAARGQRVDQSLLDAGIRSIRSGLTSVEEVERVLGCRLPEHHAAGGV